MADYNVLYNSKRTSMEEVAKQVQSGWLLGMDAGPAQANGLMVAIAEKIAQTDTKDVKVQFLLDTYPYPFLDSNALFGKFTGYSWFSSGGARKAVNGGWADVMPSYYRDIPGHILREYDYDAFCVSVSPWTATAISVWPLPLPIPQPCSVRPSGCMWKSTNISPEP